MYTIKELFYTLQGEGANVGRPAVFCRFAGCNLWTGREQDRHKAVCQFCDTDFIGTDGEGGGKFKTAADLAKAVQDAWPHAPNPKHKPLIVCTGGEPLLQLDQAAVDAFHEIGFEIAVETNGTQHPPQGIDWICVSPKADSEIVLTSGHELKLVYPQMLANPDRFVDLDFEHFFLQPMDGPDVVENTALTLQYCLDNPQWRMGIQTHKILNIP